jgi:HK97 family phage portal protein
MSTLDRFIQSNLPQQIRRGESVKAAGTMERVGVQSLAGDPDLDIGKLQRAVRRSEIVYAALRAKADAAKDPRLMVQQRTSGMAEWQEVEGHPLKRLLMRPNDRMDGAQLLIAMIVSWDVARKVYLQKLYANGNATTGAVVGLNPLDPSLIKKQRDGTYVWGTGKDRQVFQPEDLIIREALGWYDPPPLSVAMGSVDADTSQTDYIRAFFANAGTPYGILTSDQELKPAEADEIRGRWRALFSAMGRRFDVAVLGKGATYTRMGANLDELDSETLREFTETRVCMAFGVPPLILYAYAGLKRATYSNLKEAFPAWWETTLTPMFKDWLSWLTWNLLPLFEDEERIYSERVRLHFDFSEVKALQEDQTAKEGRARENFRAGGISRAEYRAQLGEQATPEDDFFLLPLAVQIVPVGASVVDVDPETGATPAKAARMFATKALKAASTATIERRIEREMKKLLETVYERVADAARKQGE